MSAASSRHPIERYGLIGDTRTAALVSADGSIDWMCVPRFDGPSVFGSLVGGPEGGSFAIRPAAPVLGAERAYRPSSVTLETRWTTTAGRLVLADGMVSDLEGRLLPSTVLVRTVEALEAPVEVEVLFDPRLGPARRPPATRRIDGGQVASWGATALSLTTDREIRPEPGRPVRVTVEPGRPLTLVLGVAHREPGILVPPAVARARLAADERMWADWCEDVDRSMPHREAVIRSLLTLRLLTYSPSGAPVAAPTTSLPEEIGGGRNWDYRYAWPRDASIGIAAFLGVGKHEEALGFLAWLLHASRLDRPRIPALLTVDGRPVPRERTLDGWPGYEGSRPVRVGNGAREQHQLDVYGWVVDAAWRVAATGRLLGGETWRAMAGFADEVARRWHLPDSGIWEVRDAPAHHVHSKVMAWVALDRALRIAGTRPVSARRRRRWTEGRRDIEAWLGSAAVDPERGVLTGRAGSPQMDAAVLLAPIVGLGGVDRSILSRTVDAIRDDLGVGGPLLRRYPPGNDGIDGGEGAFLPCSFWLVEALAAVGRREEAEALFDQLVRLAGPLGLYAEELDPATGAHLGNHPQAFTHATLVQAALALAG